jgi:molybdopterin-synthase adenylyltransferase
MGPDQEAHYRVAPGLDVIKLTDNKVLFRGDAVQVVLEGGSTSFFLDRILPLLNGKFSLSEIIDRIPEVGEGDLGHHLQDLVDAGVLLRVDPNNIDRHRLLHPLSSLLGLAHRSAEEADEILARARIAIFGLEGPGASLAAMLSQLNIGELFLADPYPCLPGNLVLMPPMDPAVVGRPRHEVVRWQLLSGGSNCVVHLVGNEKLTEADVALAAEQCDILVAAFDRGFASINHWINRASLSQGKPAIFAEFDARSATLGPLVIPGMTACYMCYRMRALACADDFGLAEACERHLEQQEPRLHERPVLPSLSYWVAAGFCNEILKHLLGLSADTMAGRLITFSAIDMRTDSHAVLEQPLCPECKKKDLRGQHHRTM